MSLLELLLYSFSKNTNGHIDVRRVFEILIPTFNNLFEDEHKREVFLTNILNFEKFDVNYADPIELFSCILMAYLNAAYSGKNNFNSFADNEKFLLFCRDELGVYKAEMSVFFQSLQLLENLKRLESYQKRGPRRQKSFVFQENFVLSLKLGLISNFLTIKEFVFWMNEREYGIAYF